MIPSGPMTTFFAAFCWSCGYAMDAHSAIGDRDATPGDGDVSICLACGEPGIYQSVLGGLVIRRPTDTERTDILQDPTIISTLLAHRAAIEQNPTDWPRGPRG